MHFLPLFADLLAEMDILKYSTWFSISHNIATSGLNERHCFKAARGEVVVHASVFELIPTNT
jgi:hypothetical protein